MTRHWLIAGLSLLSLATALPAQAQQASAPSQAAKPNFLVIVADDLGFSDLGAFGGEIRTPNLDALAKRGLRLTGFHSTPTCSPTRSMLLSGTDNHRAGLGNMAEMVAPNQKGQPGHEGYLSPHVVSLAERLRAGGYRTLLSGKWHLGLAPEQDPHARGFDQSFALLQGADNHFGRSLANDPRLKATYTRNGQVVAKLPDNFYSSDYFASNLVEQLETSKASGKPFFAYLAFSAPHWPLQAPAEDIARYRGKYDAGFEALRKARLAKQVELGLLDAGLAAHDPVLRNGGWDQFTPEQKAEQARGMEVYAAMVDRLDQNVGKVIDYLKRTGQYDNTVILFTSDNGAEGLDLREGRLPAIKDRLAQVDNSLANLGSATSYYAYGPGWAQAATAPSRLFKAYTTEGGTRVAAFIAAPGQTRQGAISGAFGTVQDVVPTFLELAGLPAATTSFEGRTVEPVRGTSWASYLAGKSEQVHPQDEATGWELFGHRALRQGDWKLVGLANGAWELFNVVKDPGETRDLAQQEPAKLQQLVAAWQDYVKQVGVILPDRTYQP